MANAQTVSLSDSGSLLSASSTGVNGWGKGGKPKPTPTPTPAPTPRPDAQRVWGNTGTDFNANGSWTAGSGGVAPGAGDVAAFDAAEVTQPKLSASVSIAGVYFTGAGTSGYDLTNTAGETLTLTASGTTIGAETGNTDSVAIGAENTSGTNTISTPIILAPNSGSTSTIFQATGGTLTLSGVVSGTGIGLTKTGGGILTVSGSSANTYTGTTTINAGELDLNKTAGTNAIAGNITIGDGSGTDILKLLASNQIADTSDMTINSSGQFVLTNLSETIDALNGSAGATILLGSTGSLTVGANNESAANYAGNIQDSGDFIKTGTGTQILSGSSIFSGNLQILSGDLRFDSGGNADNATIRLGATSGSSSATLSLGVGNGNIVSSALEVRSGSSGTKVLRSLATTGTNTYAGIVTMNADLTLQSSTGGELLLSGGSIDVKNHVLTENANLNGNNADTLSIQGLVTINEALGSSLATGGSLVKDGSGTLIIQSTGNNYTGTDNTALNVNGTTIEGGILGIYGDTSLGLAPSSASNNIFFAASPTSATTGPTLQDTANNVTLAATRNINVASGVTGTFDSNGNTFTVNGVIDGSGNIAKAGAGTLILNGNNTYAGTTTVNAGTMLVNGDQSLATGAVTVNNTGTTLGGSGTIGGSVTVNSGANLSPGSSPGILSTGSLTLNSGSNFVLDLNNTTPGTGFDRVSVTGTVSLLNLSLTTLPNLVLNIGGSLSVGDKFFVVVNDGVDPVTGAFSSGATITSGNYVFLIDYVADSGTGNLAGGNDILLEVTAVPEPGTWIAGGLTLLAVGYILRRRFARVVKQA